LPKKPTIECSSSGEENNLRNKNRKSKEMFLSYRRILDAKWTPFIGKMWAFVLKRSRRIIGQGRSERSGLT